MNPELLTLRDALKVDRSDDAIITALVSAFGVGYQSAHKDCGCRKCPVCGQWLPGGWCDLCEETMSG